MKPWDFKGKQLSAWECFIDFCKELFVILKKKERKKKGFPSQLGPFFGVK